MTRASWLSLILDSAPPEEFDQLSEQLSDGVDAAEHDRVLTEARRALQVRALLEQGRRRSAELTVLNDLSQQLTAIREPSVLLHEVAVQARRLLSVDVAYIMLREKASTTLRIRVVDGSLGSALRNTELYADQGIGGRVLATGRPLWTENYLADERIRHRREVDEAAVAERLGGILGVPLRLEEDTIGVLLVAEHRPRPFTEAEVVLLSALAAPAAIAIRNAELFERYQQAVHDLDTSNARIRKDHEATQQAAELHDQLMDTVLHGGGATEIVNALAEALDGATALVNESGEILAAAHISPEHVRHVIANLRTVEPSASRGGGMHTALGTVDGQWCASAPVVTAQRTLGRLILLRAEEPDDRGVRSLERGATVVALTMSSEQAAIEAERRARGEFLAALLGGYYDDAVVGRRARAAGVDLESVRSVVVLNEPDDSDPLKHVVNQLARRDDCWAGEHAGHTVLLLGSNPDTTRGVIEQDAERTSSGNIAIAGCTGGVQAVASAYEEAGNCLRLLSALGRTGNCAVAAELGIYNALLAQASAGDVQRFITAQLGPLLAHDETRGSDLVGTLDTYLSSARQHRQTCRTLNIHTNTLYQRLDRITELLGEAWKGQDRAFELQFALRLRRLS